MCSVGASSTGSGVLIVSGIRLFEDFIENSLHAHATHVIYYGYGIQDCHTVICLSLQLSAKQCLLQRYLLGESSLRVQQLKPRGYVHRQSCSLGLKTVCHMSKLFAQTLKTHENLAL